VRHVTDDERRARLAVRHALAPGAWAGTPEAVTRALTVLHATEPATVYLACRARMAAFERADLDRALYAERSLVKQLAMRRTLFVFPRDLLPAAWAGPSARVLAAERVRMAAAGPEWLDRLRADVLAALIDAPEGRTAKEIRAALPALDDAFPVSQILNVAGAAGDIVRGVNTGRWYSSRPRWTLMSRWLGELPPPAGVEEGYRELVRRWLYAFGPGTEDDIVWWLGATKGIVRRALAELSAVAVGLDHGGTGWLLPDDVAEAPEPGRWAALLPVLDPTVMGWRHRDFYLGPHRELIFERRGNAGTTAWLNGRVVGCWTQDDAGVVRLYLVDRVSPAGRRLLDEEAARLTDWLGGFRVPTIYASPAMDLSRRP
jgi:hypothetical protein